MRVGVVAVHKFLCPSLRHTTRTIPLTAHERWSKNVRRVSAPTNTTIGVNSLSTLDQGNRQRRFRTPPPEVLPRFQWVNEESRGSPCDPAGRSLRPFWPPFTRRKPRFVIFTGLGFQRRSIGARYPSNPWHSRRDQLVKASVRTREPRSRSFWRGAMRESSLPLTSCPTPTAKTGSRSCSTASAASSPQQDGTLSR